MASESEDVPSSSPFRRSALTRRVRSTAAALALSSLLLTLLSLLLLVIFLCGIVLSMAVGALSIPLWEPELPTESPFCVLAGTDPAVYVVCGTEAEASPLDLSARAAPPTTVHASRCGDRYGLVT